jgi:hypothetical protein
MKKILPYILIIAVSYLVVAFVANDINSSQWSFVNRGIVLLYAFFFCGVYFGFTNSKKK